MKDRSDDFARNIVPQKMSQARIFVDDFIEEHNAGRAVLVDIRLPMETAVWKLGFGLEIPANELPDRLHELPTDKMLVVACPKTDRSNMAYSYLALKGFDVRYLHGGLLVLMDRLNGARAGDIQLKD